MTAAIRTVQHILEKPGTDEPIVNKTVSFQLNQPSFINSGQREKVKARYATTDQTGLWSIELEVNDDIIPAGSTYSVRQDAGLIWTFVVPAGDEAVPVWLYDCLTVEPQAGPLPVVPVMGAIDGGNARSIYLTDQVIDGGGAAA